MRTRTPGPCCDGNVRLDQHLTFVKYQSNMSFTVKLDKTARNRSSLLRADLRKLEAAQNSLKEDLNHIRDLLTQGRAESELCAKVQAKDKKITLPWQTPEEMYR